MNPTSTNRINEPDPWAKRNVMRAPAHCRCGSVSVIALVAILLMSFVGARAAGHRDDAGFFQAVIDGRKDARETYERAKRKERQEAAKAGNMREQGELARKSTYVSPISGQPAAGTEDTGPGEDPSPGFPWIPVLMGAVALGALGVFRIRTHARR